MDFIYTVLLKYLKPDEIEYYFNVSVENAYIYFATPKCACSSILATLQRLELKDTNYIPGLTQVHERSESPLGIAWSVPEFGAMMEDDKVLKFTFVRNPYVRVLSAYLSKVARVMEQKPIILQLLGRDPTDLLQHVSFAEFLSAVSKQAPREMDGHWRPLALLTAFCEVPYQFVGKVERYDRDVARLDELLGGKFAPYLVRSAEHATSASQMVEQYYTPELAAQVRDIYRDDFELFGYSSDLADIYSPD